MSARFFENLETRRLMSASLVNGMLRIDGTDSADAISLHQFGTTMRATVNGTASDFVASAVKSILVNAKAGHDRVTIGSLVTRPATIYGGAGNDTITGGAGNDLIYGGEAPASALVSKLRRTTTSLSLLGTSKAIGRISPIMVTPKALIQTDHDVMNPPSPPIATHFIPIAP